MSLPGWLSSAIARVRRLLADRRGTVFVEYSSLVLLIAIAALALATQSGHGKIPH
jgi:Flp pilus assembly pilin Flp